MLKLPFNELDFVFDSLGVVICNVCFF